MSRKTYASELERVLAPLGFVRRASGYRYWHRTRGQRLEIVDLQTSPIAGTTANLFSRDLVMEALLHAAMPDASPAHFSYGGTRIGDLIDGKDRWWKNDPNGPQELAEAVAAHAPAHFDRLLAPPVKEDLKERAANPREWSRAHSTIYLALLLYRAGELEDARKVLDRKLSKFTSEELLEDVETVRLWLGCPPRKPSTRDSPKSSPRAKAK